MTLNLRIGARARLMTLQIAASTWNTGKPPSMQRTWRDMRYSTFRDMRQEFNPAREPVPAENFMSGRTKHSGWFCDAEGQETMAGMVIQLTHGRFAAGYFYSAGDMGLTIDASRIYTDEHEAAQQSDELARIAADHEREFQEAESARILATETLDARIVELHEAVELHRTYLFARGCAKNADYQAKQSRKAAQVREMAHSVIESIRALRAELQEAM